ncbi:hypothetical protein GT347_20260 [Xylophilus rhododendri]|uniref:Uncharacterized protein n=1 Tax=Xylophilus rhododendri TaxID=2697032 RepID=A0A857J8B7_9BURK|nr:hypothetical protein [Xylophilus rhododendri]QHJ00107.1 hypothetical protein GT347_20260 [Xylophilus rhododendri]
MMKKEAEQAVRSLCHSWQAKFHPDKGSQEINVSDFLSWLKQAHPEVFDFRTKSFAPADFVEMWADQEFKQSWRN